MSNYKKLNNLCNYNGIAYISNQKFILPNSQIYNMNCTKNENDKNENDKNENDKKKNDKKKNDKKKKEK